MLEEEVKDACEGRHGCPLYPRKRTFGRVHKMSAKCEKRTCSREGGG